MVVSTRNGRKGQTTEAMLRRINRNSARLDKKQIMKEREEFKQSLKRA